MKNPLKSKQIAEVLIAKANEVFDGLKMGKPLDEIGRGLGIFPFHIQKFYAASQDHRELYREALDINAKMLAKVKVKHVGKRAMGDTTAIVIRNRDRILELISEGKTLAEVAELLDVTRSAISIYFRKTADDETKALYEEAKVMGGEALAEMSVAAVSRPAFDLVDAKMAELRARQLSWLAGKVNPVFGDRQQVDLNAKVAGSVSISINA